MDLGPFVDIMRTGATQRARSAESRKKSAISAIVRCSYHGFLLLVVLALSIAATVWSVLVELDVQRLEEEALDHPCSPYDLIFDMTGVYIGLCVLQFLFFIAQALCAIFADIRVLIRSRAELNHDASVQDPSPFPPIVWSVYFLFQLASLATLVGKGVSLAILSADGWKGGCWHQTSWGPVLIHLLIGQYVFVGIEIAAVVLMFGLVGLRRIWFTWKRYCKLRERRTGYDPLDNEKQW